jgi:pimeloyl-ACP methyl ester carboxylesterase
MGQGQEPLELARICKKVYPGPLNHKALIISGLRIREQRYIHGSFGRGFCRIFSNDQSVVVAFRGTRERIDWWISNFRFVRERLTDCGPGASRIGVHRGFQQALDHVDKTSGKRSLDAIFHVLKELEVGDRALWITGHSLGGAIATVFAAKLRYRDSKLVSENLRGVTLFGAPAVGGKAFKAHYGSLNNVTTRYICNFDPVPFTPPLGFSHVGLGRWYRSGEWTSDPGWFTRLTLAAGHRPSLLARDHSMDSYIAALSQHAGI